MALGFKSMAADLGENVKIVLRSDSSAALGIGGRQGLGKFRHLEAGFAWLQDMLTQEKFSIKKVKDIQKHLTTLNFSFHQGRNTAVPCINGVPRAWHS